jgi:hypothetical protein
MLDRGFTIPALLVRFAEAFVSGGLGGREQMRHKSTSDDVATGLRAVGLCH